jgi:hypothetical protein
MLLLSSIVEFVVAVAAVLRLMWRTLLDITSAPPGCPERRDPDITDCLQQLRIL